MNAPSSKSKSRFSQRLKGKTLFKRLLQDPAAEIAENVLRLRKARGLSQKELAERMGTKQPQIARIESGTCNVRISTLTDIAEALDATVQIDLRPAELMSSHSSGNRWWNELPVFRNQAFLPEDEESVKCQESQFLEMLVSPVDMPFPLNVGISNESRDLNFKWTDMSGILEKSQEREAA